MSGFSINTVVVDGNLTRDPEVRSTQSGTAVCSLRIAHNERVKGAHGDWTDRTHYFDVTIWSGMGEWAGRELGKGDRIVVHGRLQWREWENRDGAKRQAVDITAFSIVPVPRGERSGGGGSGSAPRSDIPVGDDFAPVSTGGGGRTDPPDDDIPF